MNPIKSPYDLLLERAGLQYGNPATPVKGAQDMMAEMIAAGHPIQKFKEGKKATAKMAPGATLPDTTHTPLLQQGKDRLQQMGQNILDAHARQQALQNQAFEPNSVTKVRDPKALAEITNDMLAGPLSFMPAGIVKEKGGQWLNDFLKYHLEDMKPGAVWGDQLSQNEIALNKWIDSNLGNYIKNQMGTKEDPVRALAEQGVLHFDPFARDFGANGESAVNRALSGLSDNLQGVSPLAKKWEELADASIRPTPAKAFQGPYNRTASSNISPGMWAEVKESQPWLQKLDPEERVYRPTIYAQDTNFSHVIDILKQDLASGAIRPDQLSKVSVADAVKRTHDFNEEAARKMAKTKLQAQTEMPVHKDYGESGYKWYELKHPTNPDITEQALKYEGDTMGHCVGGYCPDVLAGRSKIYSLRDTKGEPHVTVEVAPPQYGNKFGHLSNLVGEEKANEMFNGVMFDKSLPKGLDLFDAIKQKYNFSVPELPGRIIQIKGKQNAAPKDEYLPYVQDFVKSGNWEHVGDLYNAKLYDTSNMAELANVYPSNAALQDLHRNARFSILNRAQKQNTYPTDRFITREDYENLLLQNRPPQIPE